MRWMYGALRYNFPRFYILWFILPVNNRESLSKWESLTIVLSCCQVDEWCARSVECFYSTLKDEESTHERSARSNRANERVPIYFSFENGRMSFEKRNSWWRCKKEPTDSAHVKILRDHHIEMVLPQAIHQLCIFQKSLALSNELIRIVGWGLNK